MPVPDSFAQSADGVVLIANGIDAVLAYDGITDQAVAAGVAAPASAPTVAASGSGSLTGTYTAYVRFVDRRGNFSDLSPLSNQIVISGKGSIDYTGVPVSAQATVARRQILRNTDGQADTYFVDVDTTELATTSFSSTRTDTDLSAQESVPLFDDNGVSLIGQYGQPPDTKPYLCFHIGRMWAAGEQPYAEGGVQVTTGSATVTGIGTAWPANFVGRFLYVQGSGIQGVEIDTVDQVNQTLTLVDAYTGPTDKFAQYAIKPAPAEIPLLYYSAAGLPEAWPPTNALSLPADGDDVTGLLQFGSFLYILKRRRMYRMTAQTDPGSDGFLFYALGRGCVNHRSWCVVEENLYLLDEGGIYRTGGGDQAEQLSGPIQNLFRRDELGINWAGSRFFHCSYDPAGETIRWFVTLYGEYLPRHALALHYKSGGWWVEEWPVPVGCNVLGRAGRPTGGWGDDGMRVFLGGPAGELLALGGNLDGVPSAGPTTRGTVTSAGLDGLTDSRAQFDTGWANVPVAIVDGRGAGQLRRVVSATATTLRVDEPWATMPDTTSVYQVGGIRFQYRSGRVRYMPGEDTQGVSVEVQFVPTTGEQTFDLRIYQDFAAVAVKGGRAIGPGQKPGVVMGKNDLQERVKMNAAWGHYWKRIDHHRETSQNSPRLLRVEIAGVSGPEVVRFGEMLLNGMVK